MILKSKEFKAVCSSILGAIDSNVVSEITETLELVTEGRTLYLNVTNGEYYASKKFELEESENIHATVKASTFLKLVDKITTDEIEIKMEEGYLLVKANGNYKLPFVMDGDNLLQLPQIRITNILTEMEVPYSILNSISLYNSKSIADTTVCQPVQKLYYLDEKGCMTYSNTACVNSFELEKPIKLLLNDKLVKLFKLFRDSELVKIVVGKDALSETISQTKISLMSKSMKITAILNCNDDLLRQVKVDQIRRLASQDYGNKVVLNKTETLEAVNRLILFNDNKAAKTYTKFKFDVEGNLTIYDMHEENSEILHYQRGTEIEGEYEMTLDIVKFAKVLESCADETVTLNFGNHQACIVSRLNVKTIIREVVSI